MNREFTQETKIEEIACKILRSLIEMPNYPRYLTNRHKQNSEYGDKFEKEFLKELSYEQRKDYDSIMSTKNLISSTEYDYILLCGMQIKAAIDEIMKNPLKILRLCDEIGIPACEIYKSVKQKMEEKDNG